MDRRCRVNDTDQTNASPPAFAPTRWTVVLRARGESPDSRKALAELCECYWAPVFRFLRSEGRDEDTARELTQEFFARLLAGQGLQGAEPERGRFRSYLLGAVKHFLADQRDHQRRLKRGGGVAPQSLEALNEHGTSPELQVPDPAASAPDSLFDRAWALAVMDRALAALQREFADSGKAAHFEALKPWLVGEAAGLSQTEAAARLGLNEGAVKVAVHRLRKRFRELVRAELAQTVGPGGEVEAELRYLVEVLSQA
jgi:RNA polymerase sigma factor (sigma-70 family)